MQVQPLQVLTTSYGAYNIMLRTACQIYSFRSLSGVV